MRIFSNTDGDAANRVNGCSVVSDLVAGNETNNFAAADANCGPVAAAGHPTFNGNSPDSFHHRQKTLLHAQSIKY